MKDKKLQPWRIVVAVAAIAYIAYMWVKKDIIGLYASMGGENLAPMLATNLAVTLLKLAAIAAVVYIIKRIASVGSKREK